MSDNLSIVMKSEPVAERVRQLLKTAQGSPAACVIPGKDIERVRYNGGFVKASVRHLVWCEAGNAPAVLAPPRCGIAGCVNPRHQLRYSDMVEARQKAKLETRKRLLEDQLQNVNRSLGAL